MNPSDFIGFTITILAIGFLAYRYIREARLRRKHPEIYQQEVEKKERELQEFLSSLDIDGEKKEEKRPEAPKPIPPPAKAYRQEDKPRKIGVLEQNYKFVTADLSKQGESYEVTGKDQPSRIYALLKRLPSKKEMVLMQEIMGPPKGK